MHLKTLYHYALEDIISLCIWRHYIILHLKTLYHDKSQLVALEVLHICFSNIHLLWLFGHWKHPSFNNSCTQTDTRISLLFVCHIFSSTTNKYILKYSTGNFYYYLYFDSCFEKLVVFNAFYQINTNKLLFSIKFASYSLLQKSMKQ